MPQVLQAMILPDPALDAELSLHLRLQGGADCAQGVLRFGPGSTLRGDTYYNLFNLGKWQDQCALKNLSLRLTGSGVFDLTIWGAAGSDQRQRLVIRQVDLKEAPCLAVPLDKIAGPMVLYYELRARTGGQVDGADWITTQAPLRRPRLMLSITTFKREKAVERSAARFSEFIAKSPFRDDIELLVVDNGASAEIAQSDHLRLVQNENLGGSGGFARGLLEARARGASHCLFMDDDAAIHMQSLERTWMFLAYASDPTTAVLGAISSGQDGAVLWENGAVFDSRCWPRFSGVNLRVFAAVLEMELATTHPAPPGHYGGWWFFAFPVDYAPHMPFPFFVRGDDISFSLVNGFNLVSLPGVMCFQDVGFSERESPLTLYLDLRSHLVHHLALPGYFIGRLRTARIAAWFFARSLFPCHYETLAALNLAVEDVLRGPDFFAAHADMAQRRSDIAALRQREVWRDETGEPALEHIRFDPQSTLARRVMKLTLNGHLLPFFSRYGNRVRVAAHHRGSMAEIWGASHVTYVDQSAGQSYSVQHDKSRALPLCLKMSWNIWRLIWRYHGLRRMWREGYARLTRGDFWSVRLGQNKQTR